MKNPIFTQFQYSDSDSPHHEHYHLSGEMVFVEEGEAEFVISGKIYRAEKNSILFINSYEPHETRILSLPYRRYFAIIHTSELERAFPSSVLPGIFKNRPAGFLHCISLDKYGAQARSVFAALEQEMNQDAPFDDRMVRLLLEQLLILVYRACPGNFSTESTSLQNRVQEIRRYIESHFTEDIRISELAEKYYLNHCYLTHKFKEQIGYSPKQYILLNRLSYAKELLETTDIPISQIAFQCGFGDFNNFSRAFRDWFQVTPKQYRKEKTLDISGETKA